MDGKIIEEFCESKFTPNFDYFFRDKAFTIRFISELIRTCNNLHQESNREFDFIFLQKNKLGISTYLLIDYNIISISFVNFLKNQINSFHNHIIQSFINNKIDYEINLFSSLGKKKLIYFNLHKKFSTKYSLYRYTNEDLYILNFDGLALDFEEIKKLLENNNEILIKFLSLVKSNYHNFKNVLNYPKGRKYKTFNNFEIKKSMIYKDIFGDENVKW